MRSYIELIGLVAKAPEIRVTSGGDRQALLVIETRESWRDNAGGERRSRSTWHDVRVGKSGVVKAIERELSGGELIFLTGALRYSEWTDARKVERKTAEIVVKSAEHQLIFLAPASGVG